ncbi:11532_t:CDS:1, partial [Ambispora gerdemannii]
MGSEKDLTEEQKGAIVYGYRKNDSYRTIAANVGCRKSVVGNVIRRFCESGTVKSQAVRTGRPPLLTVSDRSVLKTLVTSENRRLNLAQITTTLAAQTKRNVSRKTVRRALHKEDLWSRVARPKPLISTVNAARRLAWCLAHKDWTARHFRRVL